MEKYIDPLLTKLCDEVTTQEERKGFFNSLVGTIKANTNLFEWADEQLSNNVYGEDFLRALTSNVEIFDSICETFCVSEVYRKKCNNTSNKLLQESKKYWSGCEYEKCKQHCSAAILRADLKQEWGRNLTQEALLIRSRCFIETKKYDFAKKDLGMAIRMGLVQEPLKKDFKEVLQTLKKVKSQEDNGENVNSGVISSLSSHIDLTETDDLGRFYMASKDIDIGENLIIEKPYSSYLVQNCFGTHCHHCFNRLEAPVACPDCSTIAFCSEICLEEAMSTYHQYECKYLQLFIGSGMAILCFVALRIVTQVGLDESLKIYNKYVSKTKDPLDIKSETKFDHESFFKLCTHEENRCSQDYVRRTLVTFFLLRCLKNTFFGKPLLSNTLTPQELAIWSLLLRSLQLLQFNAHQIMDHTNTKEIAYGLFPKTSMMNHQCSPNVSRLFFGKYMIIKALQPISRGQMIGDSYGPQWGRSLSGSSGQKRDERRRILSSRYWFLCKCITCCQNWPTPPPDMPFIKCLDNSCHGNINKDLLKCSSCNMNVSEQDVGDIQNKLKLHLENIKDSLKMEDTHSKIITLTSHIKNYWKYTRMPCPVVIKAEDVLRSSYSKLLSGKDLILQ